MLSRHSTFRHLRLLAGVSGFFALFLAVGCAHLPYVLTENKETIVAVDVALEPDAVLDNRASTGKTHITLVRGFIRSSEVPLLSAAVANVMATTRFENLNLTATGYRTGVWNGVNGTAMTVDASAELRRLEERMVDALRIFAVDDVETAEDFIVTPDGSEMDDNAMRAIERFVPDSSGLNFRPHALVGPAQVEAAKKLESQQFASFTFKPSGAAVYQLGRLGAAEKLLWTWTGEPGAKRP